MQPWGRPVPLAARKAHGLWAQRAAPPVGGTEYVPRREFWWDESDLHSHLAESCSAIRERRGLNAARCWYGATSRNESTTDKFRWQ